MEASWKSSTFLPEWPVVPNLRESGANDVSERSRRKGLHVRSNRPIGGGVKLRDVLMWGAMLSMMIASPVMAHRSASQAVAAFIAKRDKCDHFRGEEAYDQARGRFIAAQTKRYCTGTDRRLKALRARYAKHPKQLAKLADYEESIE